MSRVGNALIEIPDKVTVTVHDGEVQVKGPLGQIALKVVPQIQVGVAGKTVKVTREAETQALRARHGLIRNLVHNMVIGVSEGYRKSLDINGVGYRAEMKGKDLVLSLGFSHPVIFPVPQGIKITVNKQTNLVIEGVDKQLVGETAARIRELRPPEPYKGKGIKFTDEVIRRKAGKAAA